MMKICEFIDSLCRWCLGLHSINDISECKKIKGYILYTNKSIVVKIYHILII